MDPSPRTFAELPVDPDLGVPVPFACGTPDQAPASWLDGQPSARTLDHRRVTQCALSRVCGVCGAGLGRPLALLGSADELDRLAFHLPPAHAECVEELLESWRGVDAALAGQPVPLDSWVVVTTGGFEYVRPVKGQRDTRAVFEPNSLLTQRAVVVSPSARASG